MPGIRPAYRGQPWNPYAPAGFGPTHTEEPEAAQLIRAVRLGDRIDLQNLLRSGADPNSAVDKFGATPMHAAAGCEGPCGAWMLEEMMRVGGNPNIRDVEGLTPLHLACIGNRVDCLRTLIEHGGDHQVKSGDNYNALGYARKHAARECIAFLLNCNGETRRPPLSTMNGGRRLQRQNSDSSINPKNIQYHSACGSPVQADRQQVLAAFIRKSSNGKYPDADFDSDAYISPVVERKSVMKRSTSGNREVPRLKPQARFTQGWSSDSENEREIPIDSNSRLRSSSTGRTKTDVRTFLWPYDQCHQSPGMISKQQSKSSSVNDLDVERRSSRRVSGKEKDSATGDIDREISTEEYAQFASVTDEEIRRLLRDLGADPGPINSSSSRSVYLNKLIRLRKNGVKGGAPCCVTQTALCGELKQILTQNFDKDQLRILRRDFQTVFRGLPKSSFFFTYLLVDPRISQNLAHQVNQATEADIQSCFKNFLRSVFYIGKGKNSRPMHHLVQAKRVFLNRNLKTSPKLDRICSIWENAYGVVCIQVFDHRGEEEACTRESLMIEAIGIDKLTNERRGTAYGSIGSWSGSRRRLLGSSFLFDAFNHLLVAGEHQIFPQDIHV